MTADKLPDFYTIPQAAKALGKSERQTWRYTKYEDPYALKVTTIGRNFIILADDLEDFKERVKGRPDNRGQYDRSKRAPRKKKAK